MQFQFEGKTYRLEFQRDQKEIPLVRKGRVEKIKSKYPYTTVRLLEIEKDRLPKMVESAQVGCAPFDNYTNERGRLEALRALTKRIYKSKDLDVLEPIELVRIMWQTYTERSKPVVKVPPSQGQPPAQDQLAAS